MKFLGQNLYQSGPNAFTGRLTIHGRRTYRKLRSITARAAREELAKLQSDHDRSQLGLCPDPFAPTHDLRHLAGLWSAAGYPDRRRRPATDAQRTIITTHLKHLLDAAGDLVPTALTVGWCDRYHDRRCAQIERGPGHRTVELELTTLSNLLTWSARADHITHNPLAGQRPSYRTTADIRHCTATMPQDDDTLHALGTFLFDTPGSESLGWQLLLEALTGCRTTEILRLRHDATKLGPTAAPGYRDEKTLYIERAKKGVEPYVPLDAAPGHSPLRACLEALDAWRRGRHPDSPWYLPGRDPQHPLSPLALTHALGRACKILGLPHITSHGLRAYHVRFLRSLGVDDSEIAKRLGHRSGVALVERTYGRTEPGWYGSRAMDGLPSTGAPAWDRWITHQPTNIIPIAASA